MFKILDNNEIYLGKAAPNTSGGGGSGDSVSWGNINGVLSNQTDLQTALNGKQNTLVSGTDIKTINNVSLLNSGNLTINGLPSQTGNSGKFLTTDGTDASWASVSASVPNQNTAVGATNPLLFWEGTSAEYESGGGSQTWYNWQSGGGLSFNSSTIPAVNTLNWKSVTYGNGTFVAIALNSGITAYSSDGTNWNTGSITSRNWRSIIYANNMFVAVAFNSSYGAYSSDGLTWNDSTMPEQVYLNDITYGNGIFVAVSIENSNYNVYSSDGQTWLKGTMPSSANWYAVCYGDNKFIAVANNSDKIAISSDGINWTAGTLPSSQDYCSIAYGNGKFVISINNSDKVLYSSDVINWFEATLPSQSSWKCIRYVNNQFALAGAGIFAYSSDGINWDSVSTSQGVSYGASSLTYGDGKYIITYSFNNNVDYASVGQSFSVFTTSDTPTTSDTVYSAPNTTSALTITSVGTGTITLSDTNTYNYNASGNQTTSQSVGEAYPDWICMIEGVGIKKGNTTIASIAPTVDQTYNASSTNAQSGVAVASGISDSLGIINTQLESIIAQGD